MPEALEELKERTKRPIGKDNFIKRKVEDAVLEAYLAKKLMEDNLTRNAAGKAFQAWKDLVSALLYLKKEEILNSLKEDQREWFLKKGIYAPSSRLSVLSKTLEKVGIKDVSPWTDKALRLHSYQYNGPDPEGLWGGPVDEEDAKGDVDLLLKKFKEYVKKYFEDYLDEELKEALKAL